VGALFFLVVFDEGVVSVIKDVFGGEKDLSNGSDNTLFLFLTVSLSIARAANLERAADVTGVAKGHSLGKGNDDHFSAGDRVEDHVACLEREEIEGVQDLEQAALPEREEQDGLHGKELVEGRERFQAFFGGHVEQHEAVEGQGNGEVVDSGEPEVARLQTVLPLMVHIMLFKNDGAHRCNRLNQNKLEDSLLHATEENLISWQRLELVEGPRLLDPALELQVDDELVLTSKEVNQQLHEDVEHVSFVDVTHRVKGKGFLRDHDAEPSRNRVDWNYPQNSNDLQLYLGFVEVLQVHDDLVARDSHCQDCAARGEFVQQTQVVLAGGSWDCSARVCDLVGELGGEGRRRALGQFFW